MAYVKCAIFQVPQHMCDIINGRFALIQVRAKTDLLGRGAIGRSHLGKDKNEHETEIWSNLVQY